MPTMALMPTVRANGLEMPTGRGRRTTAGPAPRRDLVGGRRLGRPASGLAAGVPPLPAGCPRPRRHALGRRRRLDSRDAGRRPGRLRRRARARDLPPARLLHGRPYRAALRDAPPGAAAHAARVRHRRPATAAHERGASPDGPGAHRREEPAWAAASSAAMARPRARAPGVGSCPPSPPMSATQPFITPEELRA